jgi:hypothetical protein
MGAGNESAKVPRKDSNLSEALFNSKQKPPYGGFCFS